MLSTISILTKSETAKLGKWEGVYFRKKITKWIFLKKNSMNEFFLSKKIQNSIHSKWMIHFEFWNSFLNWPVRPHSFILFSHSFFSSLIHSFWNAFKMNHSKWIFPFIFFPQKIPIHSFWMNFLNAIQNSKKNEFWIFRSPVTSLKILFHFDF